MMGSAGSAQGGVALLQEYIPISVVAPDAAVPTPVSTPATGTIVRTVTSVDTIISPSNLPTTVYSTLTNVATIGLVPYSTVTVTASAPTPVGTGSGNSTGGSSGNSTGGSPGSGSGSSGAETVRAWSWAQSTIIGVTAMFCILML